MKYTLNKLKTKTTNNFKVNDITLDLEIPKFDNFKDYVITNNSNIKIDISLRKENITSSIGLTLDKYKEVNLTIPKNIKIEEPIIFEYNFNENDNLVDYFNITYEEDSSADIIIIYKSTSKSSNFHFYKENLINKANSFGTITLINLLNDNSYNFYSIENETLKNSNITHNIIDLGGKIRLSNMISNLVEEKSKNTLNNIYLGVKDNIIDNNYYLTNKCPNTTNIIRAEGSLDDNSHKTFRGIIDFIKGSRGSVGDEKENCILLSDNVVSRSLPELLCGEEDVIGAHGVSTGKVSQSKLFYLMSRGFDEVAAKKLIIFANFSSIINKIPSDDIQDEVKKFIDKKII